MSSGYDTNPERRTQTEWRVRCLGTGEWYSAKTEAAAVDCHARLTEQWQARLRTAEAAGNRVAYRYVKGYVIESRVVGGWEDYENRQLDLFSAGGEPCPPPS